MKFLESVEPNIKNVIDYVLYSDKYVEKEQK